MSEHWTIYIMYLHAKFLLFQALVLKLPDRGDKIRKQMSELNLQLIKIRDSPPVHDTEKTQTVEVIDLDSLSEDLQRVVSVWIADTICIPLQSTSSKSSLWCLGLIVVCYYYISEWLVFHHATFDNHVKFVRCKQIYYLVQFNSKNLNWLMYANS